MDRDEVIKYLEKNVILKDIDDAIFDGVLTNTVSKYDSELKKEEIEMTVGTYEIGIPLDEIKSIRIK